MLNEQGLGIPPVLIRYWKRFPDPSSLFRVCSSQGVSSSSSSSSCWGSVTSRRENQWGIWESASPRSETPFPRMGLGSLRILHQRQLLDQLLVSHGIPAFGAVWGLVGAGIPNIPKILWVGMTRAAVCGEGAVPTGPCPGPRDSPLEFQQCGRSSGRAAGSGGSASGLRPSGLPSVRPRFLPSFLPSWCPSVRPSLLVTPNPP